LSGVTTLDFLGGAVKGGGDMNLDGYDDAIVSAWGFVNGEYIQGAVCFFLGGPTGLASTPAYRLPAQFEAHFGYGVGQVGSFDADSRPEVVISSFLWDPPTGYADAGRMIAATMNSTGNGVTEKAYAEGTQAEQFFGHSAAGAGFVNTDSYADLVIGSPWYTNGQDREGAVYLFYGAANLSGQ
jgi:hypothetical protein